jgi:hypothetical protein
MSDEENKENKVGRILLTAFAHRAYTLDVSRTSSPKKTLTVDEVIAMLRKEQGAQSLRQYAAMLGITPGYLSDLYKGNRTPGQTILSQLGLAKKTVTLYEKVA